MVMKIVINNNCSNNKISHHHHSNFQNFRMIIAQNKTEEMM